MLSKLFELLDSFLNSSRTEVYVKKILRLVFWILLFLPLIFVPIYFFLFSVI